MNVHAGFAVVDEAGRGVKEQHIACRDAKALTAGNQAIDIKAVVGVCLD